MKPNIFRQEFRMRRRSVLTWSASVAALILVYMSLFPSFAQDAALLNEMMANFPQELLTAFGLNGVDLAKIPGYFSFVFLFVQLCLAIQAANYGFGLVSVEEREWTADFLLTKPVGRGEILTSKLLAALSGLTLTNAIVWISSLGALELFKGEQTYTMRSVLLLLASVVIFQLFFLLVGLAISLLVKRIRSVTPYALGLGLGMYVLSAFSEMLGESALEKLTPFKHWDPRSIMQHGSYEPSLALVSVAVIVVAAVASYALYIRKDIPAAV